MRLRKAIFQVLLLKIDSIYAADDVVKVNKVDKFKTDDFSEEVIMSKMFEKKETETLSCRGEIYNSISPKWLGTYFQHTTILNIGYTSLKEIPAGLENLKNLKRLNFSFNSCATDVSNVTKLIGLTSLVISRNEQLSKLPKDLGNLTKLVILNISKNSLSELP